MKKKFDEFLRQIVLLNFCDKCFDPFFTLGIILGIYLIIVCLRIGVPTILLINKIESEFFLSQVVRFYV